MAEVGVARYNKSSQLWLYIGFSIVLAMVAALLIFGIKYLGIIFDDMARISDDFYAKSEIISRIEGAESKRAFDIKGVFANADTSLVIDFFDDASSYRARILSSKKELEKMDLNARERSFLQRYSSKEFLISEKERDLIEAISSGLPTSAIKDKVFEIADIHNEATAILGDFQRYEKNLMNTARIEAMGTYGEVRLFFIVFGFFALGLGSLIAVFVGRGVEKADREVFLEKERTEVTLKSIADAVVATDANGVVQYINPVASLMTGYPADRAIGVLFGDVFKPINEITRKSERIPLGDVLSSQEPKELEKDLLIINSGGKEYGIEGSLSPMFDDKGKVTGAVLVFRDVTEARKLAKRLSFQANHDKLTGLFNRYEFERRVSRAIEGSKSDGRNHALLYIDLDQFKVVNDTCGHYAGDELLCQVSDLIQSKLRTSDTLSRLGGDEFAVLLEYCTIANAEAVANKILEAIKKFQFVWQDKKFTIGSSIGVVEVSANSKDCESVLKLADTSCYVAKDEGRNRVIVYDANRTDMEKRQVEMDWVHRISSALEENRFVLHFQKIVSPENLGIAVQYEALIRMIDKNGAILPPMAFLPSAERYSMMSVIDRWVVKTAIEMMSRKPFVDKDFVLCVNLSKQTVTEDSFPDYVIREIEAHNVDASRLCFEITETTAVANLSKVKRFMVALGDKGCKFSLDDFGSGLSSFGYLKNLSFDFIKIDGVFVSEITKDEVALSMVESIQRVATILKIKTIAEFVDSEKSLEILKKIGVDYIQGYYIAKPAGQEEVFGE